MARPIVRRQKGVSAISNELLTIDEAAKRLKIQPVDLRHLLQAKKLPAIEIVKGQQWRISATALQKFMDDAAAKGK